MIISHKKHKAHKEYRCDDCGRWINLREFYYRIFGASDESDEKPYEMLFCIDCHEAPYIKCEHCEFDKQWIPL